MMITPPISLLSPACRRRFLCGKNGNGAFSLVEVTLALGIVAFAFIAVLGLVPISLTTFRGAMETSINSQIYQQVAADLQQTDFQTLTQPQPLRYFDDQGIARGDSNAAPSAAEMATVIYQVNTVAHIPSPVLGDPLQNLATIVIEIVKNPANKPLQKNATGNIVEDRSKGIQVSRYFAYTAAKG